MEYASDVDLAGSDLGNGYSLGHPGNGHASQCDAQVMLAWSRRGNRV